MLKFQNAVVRLLLFVVAELERRIRYILTLMALSYLIDETCDDRGSV